MNKRIIPADKNNMFIKCLAILAQPLTLSLPTTGLQLMSQGFIYTTADGIINKSALFPDFDEVLRGKGEFIKDEAAIILENSELQHYECDEWSADPKNLSALIIEEWIKDHPNQYSDTDIKQIKEAIFIYLNEVQKWYLENSDYLQRMINYLSGSVGDLDKRTSKNEEDIKRLSGAHNSTFKRVEEIKCDNRIYQELFRSELFMEQGEKHARLMDVYVSPRVNKEPWPLQTGAGTLILWDEIIELIKEKKEKVAYIYGKPGSGKSSFVAFIASEFVKGKVGDKTAYIIRLRDLKPSMINDSVPVDGLLCYMNAELSDLKNTVLILDGFDEICALYDNGDMGAYLEMLTDSFQKVEGLTVIITSRPGYFQLSKRQRKEYHIFEICNWEKEDFVSWSDRYCPFHTDLEQIIRKNSNYLIEDSNSEKKKTMFSVPILFYMANAKGLNLEDYETVSSVYDAVFQDVLEDHSYDPNHRSIDKVIKPALARQICREIAFTMFMAGRLDFKFQDDPYLSPKEVNESVDAAILLQGNDVETISAKDKKRIKELYTLTFYYNITNDKENAVEFAHKSIAEYFTAEKILEILLRLTSDDAIDEKNVSRALIECFGCGCITNDICLFLKEKIKSVADDLLPLKEYLERNLFALFRNEVLLESPQRLKYKMNYLDRASIMTRSVLLLAEYLDCAVETLKADEYFNSFIANISRLKFMNAGFGIPLPFCLNGFSLVHGQFSKGNFEEAHLSGTDLEGADFEEADLDSAQFYDANLKGTGFVDARMNAAEMDSMKYADGIDFSGANLSDAILDNNQFTRCSFEESDLSRGFLRHCTFDNECSFERTNLFDADLSYSDLSQLSFDTVVFEDISGEESESLICWKGVTVTKEQAEQLNGSGFVVLEEPIIK